MKSGSKKNLVRMMSLFLAAVMCVGMLPVSALAAGVNDSDVSAAASDVGAISSNTNSFKLDQGGLTEEEYFSQLLEAYGIAPFDSGGSTSSGKLEQDPGLTTPGPSSIRDKPFARYTLVRFNLPDTVLTASLPGGNIGDSANIGDSVNEAYRLAWDEWMDLTTALSTAKAFPINNECFSTVGKTAAEVADYPITFAVTYDTTIVGHEWDTYRIDTANNGYRSNILGYIWHATNPNGNVSNYMDSVHGTESSWFYMPEKGSDCNPSWVDCIEGKHLKSTWKSGVDPMSEFFGVPWSESADVLIGTPTTTNFDARGWDALDVFWDKYIAPYDDLRRQVIADANAVAGNAAHFEDNDALSAEALHWAFAGNQDFCYKFIVEPGFGGARSNAGNLSNYALTLRDIVAQEKYKGANYDYSARWAANLAVSVFPTKRELILGWYDGIVRTSNAIEFTGIKALYPEHIGHEHDANSKIFNAELNDKYGIKKDMNIFDRGRAIVKAMKSDETPFSTFGVGIWSAWQAPIPMTPRKSGLKITKQITTELGGFASNIFDLTVTITGLPENLQAHYGSWSSPYSEGFKTGGWMETDTSQIPEYENYWDAVTGGTKWDGVPCIWDAPTGTLTFEHVPFGNGTSLNLDALWEELPTGHTIHVTVKENKMYSSIYGDNDDVWADAGSVLMSDGISEAEFCTEKQFDITKSAADQQVSITVDNMFGGVQLEKLSTKNMQAFTGVGSGDFGADHEWPFVVHFFPVGEEYDGPNHMEDDVSMFVLRSPIEGRAGTKEVLKYDNGYHLTLYHQELVLLYNRKLCDSYSVGGSSEYMWRVEEDISDSDNKALMEMTLDKDQQDWMIGFFYNVAGDWHTQETETGQGNGITSTSLVYRDPNTGDCYETAVPGLTMYSHFREMPVKNEEPLRDKAWSRCQVVNGVGEPNANVHFIIDYNLNGKSATTATGQTSYVEVDNGSNPLDCGTVTTNQVVKVDLSSYVTTKPIIVDKNGVQIQYTYKGLYDAANGGTMIVDKDGNNVDGTRSSFEWVVPPMWHDKEVVSDQLLVLYAQWDVEVLDVPDGPESGGSDDNLYWVYYDYNYDGGGVVSAMYGTFKVYEAISWGGDGSVSSRPHTVKVHFSTPENPARTGWKFLGWAFTPDAKQPDYFATAGNPVPISPEPTKGDTFFAVWEAQPIIWDANGGVFESDSAKSHTWPAEVVAQTEIPIESEEPTRTGYTFSGWYMDKACTIPAGQFEEGVQPGRTYYAGWTAERVIVTYYDTRQGTGAIVRQDEYLYNDVIDILDPMNSTDGWTWSYWGTRPDESGVKVEGWDGKAYLSQDDPDTGKWMTPHENKDKPDGSVNSDKYYWTVDIYAHWNEELVDYTLKLIYNDYQNNDGARIKTVTFGLVDSYMNNEVIDRETVTVQDLVNEQDVTLFRGLPVQDNNASLQKRTYKIVPLAYTDCWGTTYRVTAPAIDGYEADWDVQTNSIADDRTLTSYRVHLNNYGDSDNGASTGYEQGNYHSIITFDHALITTGDDIKFVIQWKDDGDNDGMRPGAVKLVLYGDGQTVRQNPLHNSQNGAVDANTGICEVTEDGNTWTYIFRDYQKYHNKRAIEYTVAVRNDDIDPVTYVGTTFNKYGYTVEYMVNQATGDAIGDPHGCTITREVERQEIPVRIVWNDENNRDGQRPDSVSLALMSYQWNDHTYSWEHQEIETMTIRTGGTNTMTAREWTGTFTTNKVYNDGVKRVYHLAVVSDLNAFIPEGSFQYGWEETVYGNQYPENGNRNAEGYNTSTPRNPVTEVTISQNTNTVSVTGQIYWDDAANNDNIRPRNVIMQLYAHAPGETPKPVQGQAYRVNLTGEPAADNWYYTFSGMPKYADGQSGVELVYTIKIEEVDGEPLYGTYISTENGPEETVVRYEASYLYENPDGMDNVGATTETDDFNLSDRAYVKLRHGTETQTVDFSIDWHDGNNQDNVRPSSVKVNLWKQVGDSEPVKLYDAPLTFTNADTMSGAAWTKKIANLPNMEDGRKVTYILDVDADEVARLESIGYTLTVEGTVIEMYYKTAKADLEAYITWSDSDDNDGIRPDNVTAVLYRNGVATDVTVDLNESNGWRHVFESLDVNYVNRGAVGTPVVYSVRVTAPDGYEAEYKPESTTLTEFNKQDGTGYVPLNITLTHFGDTRTVPVTVNWNDSNDKDGKRPDSITVQLLADGKVLEGKTLTLNAADFNGSQWTGVFENMPTYTENGRPVRYSVEVCDETAVNGVYSIMTAGTTVYLAHDPVLSTMYVSFNYNDNNNADGTRPTGMYLQLTADGVPVNESEYLHTVSLDPRVDGYKVEFGALPVYSRAGAKIAYNVRVSGLGTEEFGGEGYTAGYTTDIRLSENASAAVNQVIVRLSKTADTKTVTGSVYWFDVNNMSGRRPDRLEIKLASDYSSATRVYILDAANGVVLDKQTGEQVGDLTVNEWTGDSSVWNYSISGLRANWMTGENEFGSVQYVMTVDTTSISPYYPIVQTGSSMNASLTSSDYETYKTQATTELVMDVQWIDNGNAWGYRPNTQGITVELMAGDEVYKTVVVTSADAVSGNDGLWTYRFENLPSFRNGAGVAWTVRVKDVDKYTQSQVITEAEHSVVKFVQSQGFDFTVNWADSSNDDARRPENLTLLVKADGSEVGTVRFTGEGEQWTASIGDLPVWSESDPDRAIQYTFQWDDATETVLIENKYTASSTKDGAPVESNAFYWLSATEFGKNDAASGYDILTGMYDWETTLSYNKETADYTFDVSFDDDGDRDGLRPETLVIELLADGKVIDTRQLTIDENTASYQFKWEDMEVWDSAKAIVYTIRVKDACAGYEISYNEAHTSAVLKHEPERVFVDGTIFWDDSTEIKSLINAQGEYLRDYEFIGRASVNMVFHADGQAMASMRISRFVYGTDPEHMAASHTVTYPWNGADKAAGGVYKYRDHGTEIQYTITVSSSELDALLNDGYSMVYADDRLSATVTHDLYDINGKVYFLRDSSEDFLLRDGAATVTAYLQVDGNYVAQQSVKTDSNGAYHFENLPQGLYVIRAVYDYDNHAMAGTSGVTLDRRDASTDVLVNRDAANDGFRYEYKASGKAFYQTDRHMTSTIKPIPEGSIVLLYKITDGKADPEYLTMTKTDANGGYTFENLISADYLVTVVFNYEDGVYTYDNADAVADGLTFNINGMDAKWPDVVKQVNGGSDIIENPEAPVEPEVPEKEPVPVIAEGYVFKSVNGTHTTEPIENVDVHVYTYMDNVEVGHTQTDKNGFWHIEGLAVGSYTAVFSKQGQSSRVLVFHVTDADYANGTKIWANNDPTQYFDESESAATGTVSGIVLSEGGRPMHTLVELYKIEADGAETLYDFRHTDAQGKYEFTVTAGFDYKVRIYNVDTVTETYDNDVGYPDNELTTLEEYLVSGLFVYENKVQSGEAVLAYIEQNGGWKMVTGTLTDTAGKYTLKLKDAGNYRIVEYLDNGGFVDKYVTVGYDRALPQVTRQDSGHFTISGTESFDSLVLVKNDGGVIKARYDKRDTPYTGYTIANQDAGEYRLTLTKDGVEKTYYVSCPADYLCEQTYTVTVSGNVLDENGNAVLGSEVVLKNAAGEEIARQVILSDGSYAFTNLPEGQYSVEVTKYFVSKGAGNDGLLYSKPTTEADSFGNAYPDGMAAGQAWVWNINASRVSGTVTGIDGKPVDGLTLYFTPDGFLYYFTKTDADGKYVIGLPEGEYQVTYTLHQDLKHALEGEAGTLSVRFGEVYTKDIDNVPVQTVNVFVYRPEADGKQTALSDVAVRFLYADGREAIRTETTGGDGLASIRLIPGEYVLGLSMMDGASVVTTTASLTVNADGTVTLDGEMLAGGENGVTAPVAMQAGYTVTGTVIDSTGAPVADAIVNYKQTDGTASGRVYTDDNGQFSILIASSKTGTYRLSVNGRNLDTGEYETVAVSGDVSGIVLKLAAAGADEDYVVAGRVVDASGHPVENAEVILKTGSDKIIYAVSSTDSDGYFRFNVASGTYYLSASYMDETGKVYVTNAETMAHASEQDTEDVLVLLTAYELTVRVVDQNMNPVENAQVAWRFAGNRTTDGYFADTDANGETVRALFNSSYELKASTKGRSSKWTAVTIPNDALLEDDGRMVVTLVLGAAGLDTGATQPEVTVNGDGSMKIYGWVEAPAGSNGVLAPDEIWVRLERYDTENTQPGAETVWVEAGSTRADGNAYYEFTNLPYGKYRVSYDYTFEARASVTASGFVIDGTLESENGGVYSNATVGLYKKNFSPDGLETFETVAEVTTGDDGYFRFELPVEAAAAYCDADGQWHLVTVDGDVFAEFENGVVTAADKQYDAGDVYWIEVHDAADVLVYLGDVKPVSTAINIDGLAQDVDGKVWPYTHVDLYRNDVLLGTYAADMDGKFQMQDGLETGTNYIAKVYVPVGPVNREPYASDYTVGDYYTIDAGDAASAEAYIDKRLTGVWSEHVNTPYLRGLYDITGTVIDADGAPVEGAIVTLLDRMKNPVNQDGLTNPYITSADGYYEFLGLEPGVYYVQVSYDGKDDAAEYEVEIDDGTDHKVTDITEADKPVEFAVNVTDYTNGKASVDGLTDGQLYCVEGEDLSFAVNSDEVSMVAVRVNGELTELECVETADGYLFTVTGLTADDEIEIVIALLGDINLNGEANSEDLALFARYTFNEYQFDTASGIQELVADINRNGEANSEDLALFARYTFNEYQFVWNVSR